MTPARFSAAVYAFRASSERPFTSPSSSSTDFESFELLSSSPWFDSAPGFEPESSVPSDADTAVALSPDLCFPALIFRFEDILLPEIECWEREEDMVNSKSVFMQISYKSPGGVGNSSYLFERSGRTYAV
jgi:hypothetical protein